MSVISGQTNKVTATIGVGRAPSAIAVNQKTNAVYASGNEQVAVLGSRWS